MKKFREIGSNFCTDNFISSPHLDDRIIKAKYDSACNIIYPSLGRNAISAILEVIRSDEKVALLPGYTCESVIIPFIAAKYKIVYYNFHKNLSVDLNDISEKISFFKPDLILIHGFYGYNTFLTANEIIQSARKRGCILIQDDTQTIFSEIELLSADYYIGSIRKWLEIPDGAYICSSDKLPLLSDSINNTFIDLITKAFKLKADYVKNLDADLKFQYKKIFLTGQNLIDNDLSIFSMSDLSKGILNNYDLSLMKKRRVENFNFLLEKIHNQFKSIRTVFNAPVEDNICPIYFPLFVDQREKLQNLLSNNDIYATIIWPKFHLIEGLKEETEYIYDKIIGIPCDQRYSKVDMLRVVELLKTNFK